jgi:hypothetical protein
MHLKEIEEKLTQKYNSEKVRLELYKAKYKELCTTHKKMKGVEGVLSVFSEITMLLKRLIIRFERDRDMEDLNYGIDNLLKQVIEDEDGDPSTIKKQLKDWNESRTAVRAWARSPPSS